MTTFTTTTGSAQTGRTRRARAALVGLWALRILLSAQLAAGGLLKLSAEPTMVAMFADIGASQWLRVMVGLCECAAAVGLLVPRLVRAAGIGLVLLLSGAALTNALVLKISPALPLVLLAAVVAVLAAGRVRGAGR